MTQEQAGGSREIAALVRADGQGELRDGGRVTRMRAADSDELRGMLMERALAISFDEDQPVEVNFIDVDGIYDLMVTPDGRVDEIGQRRPLGPGDDDLTPEKAPTRGPDGGYAALFGLQDQELSTEVHKPSVPVHETERLPRAEMMAKLDYDELLTGDDAATDEDAPLSAGELFGQRAAQDAPAQQDALAAEPASAEELDDEFHDEGLDHDFDEAEPSEPEAREKAASELAAAAPSEPSEQDSEQWSPRFLRQEPQPLDVPSPPLTAERPRPAYEPPRPTASSIPPKPEHRPNPEGLPTLDDFFAGKPADRQRPAEFGWRAGLRRATGGLITLGPGAKERLQRDEIAAIQRSFAGPRTIVVMNPKGGAHKTTATLMIAATFGTMRGGYTLAWDNNETRGTLGWRSKHGVTNNTAVDLLRELPRFEITGGATIADVDRYVRNQGDAKFDVLASDDDAASAAIIDDDAFSRLHRVLSRFYRIMVIDTGNNMRASNWEAALEVADQLVIVSTAREDTAASAAWLADGLRERGYGDKLANAVTILSSPSDKEDPELTNKLTTHFRQLTRAVVSVPYDQEFVGGGELDIPSLQPSTLNAWRHAAAVIAKGL